MESCGDKTRDVRNINHHICADLVADLAYASEIEPAAVCGRTRHNHLRLAFKRDLFHRIVIKHLCHRVNSVRHDIEVHTRKIDGRAVREMSAVRKAHSHYGVARLEKGKVDRDVRA